MNTLLCMRSPASDQNPLCDLSGRPQTRAGLSLAGIPAMLPSPHQTGYPALALQSLQRVTVKESEASHAHGHLCISSPDISCENLFIRGPWLRFFSSLPHPLYPSSEAALKTNSPKTSSLGQVKNGLELSKNTTPRRLSLFDLSGTSQESSIIRAGLYLTWLRTCWMGSAIPLGLSSKTFRGDCLSSQLPGVVLPVGAYKGLTKKLEKNKIKNRMSIKGFTKSLTCSWYYRSPQARAELCVGLGKLMIY